MASNRKRRLPSSHRDVLIGEPLHYGSPRIALPDVDAQRHPQFRSPIPFRLHHRMEESGSGERLGSHEFAPAFARYLEDGLRSERQKAREWWNQLYVLDRLAEHAGDPPAPFTLAELDIALMWYRGRDLSDSGRTHFWVERACRRVQRFVRQRYFADDLVRPAIAA